MSQEFLNGFLAGVGATIFGFVLTMIWDCWKSNQQRKQLQDNLLTLLSDEIEYNSSIIKNNKSLITQELGYLKENKSIVNALDIPRKDFWEVFKLNYDYKFFSIEQVKYVKDIYFIISSIIENIQSRESYRISNQAMSNFHTRMEKYDSILIDLFDRFKNLSSDFKNFWIKK
jgi:hypothetical protein